MARNRIGLLPRYRPRARVTYRLRFNRPLLVDLEIDEHDDFGVFIWNAFDTATGEIALHSSNGWLRFYKQGGSIENV